MSGPAEGPQEPLRSADPTGCPHERAHITDSRFHGHNYTTPRSREIFCDRCRLQRWLSVEAALSLSQADVGLIPHAAAEEISRCSRVEHIDPDEVREDMLHTRHSLVALIRALERACAGGAGEYVHYGATTQDIQDTAQVLEMRDVLDAVDEEVGGVVARLTELARAHRDTPMVGRTHAQPALPTSFGLKVAGWLDELLRHDERLRPMRPRVTVAQLFGGVGTMAGFGGLGPQLLRRFAARLDLGVPAVAWHVARDRVAEFATTLATLAGTLARVADEVRTLSRPEFGELEEGWYPGRVGSSTMPHKRNPETSEQVVVLARLARTNAGLAMEAQQQEHERDSRGLRLEWAAVADVSHYTLAALTTVRGLLDRLVVHRDVMTAGTREAADSICTEALMLALAPHLGKQSAYAVVYELCNTAREHGRPLRSLAPESDAVTAHLGPDELDRVLDPARQLDTARQLVDEVADTADRWLAERGAGASAGPARRLKEAR